MIVIETEQQTFPSSKKKKLPGKVEATRDMTSCGFLYL